MSMKGLLFRLGMPLTAGGALFAALYFAESSNGLSPTLAFWLWPSLIAVTALYVAVFICANHPEWGTLPSGIHPVLGTAKPVSSGEGTMAVGSPTIPQYIGRL